MKLCVIGGAGARSAFLTKSLVKSAREIRVDHIVLLDNNEEHLRTYGQISKELARRMEPSLTFDITSDARGALTGADYIITTIRAGGDAGRLFDEKTCLAHGVLGQETTGAGGFAMAIRSVPTLVYYCTLAREVSNPGHLIFNFTNPSGIITQALRSCGFANVYGICDAPSGFIKQLEEILDVPYGALDIECYGLNHLSWFRNAKLDGRDVQEELLNNPRTYQHSEMRLFTREMARLSGECMLNEYLYFYYRREKSLSMVQKAEHPRGEMIYLINRELETQLAQMELPRDFEKAFNLYMNAYGKRENAISRWRAAPAERKSGIRLRSKNSWQSRTRADMLLWHYGSSERSLTARTAGWYCRFPMRGRLMDWRMTMWWRSPVTSIPMAHTPFISALLTSSSFSRSSG